MQVVEAAYLKYGKDDNEPLGHDFQVDVTPNKRNVFRFIELIVNNERGHLVLLLLLILPLMGRI